MRNYKIFNYDNMEIRFREKPTSAMVDMYCKKIEEFLSAQNVKLSVEVCDSAPKKWLQKKPSLANV